MKNKVFKKGYEVHLYLILSSYQGYPIKAPRANTKLPRGIFKLI